MTRLTIKEAQESDAQFVYKMMQDKKFQKHYLERLLYKSEEEAKKDIKNSLRESKRGLRYYFLVRDGKKRVGILDIYKINRHDKKASIGYGIIREHWGKGFGSAVCKIGLAFMKKKLKLHSVEATADPHNKASQKVLEKNGFALLGIAKDYYQDRGKFIDMALYWKIL